MTDFLAETAAREGSSTALSDGEGRRWSYRELDHWVNRAAVRLREAGAVPGRPLAMTLGPTAQAVVAIHAAWRVGCVVTTLDPRLPPKERDRIVELTAPAAVVDTTSWLPAVESGRADVEGAAADLPSNATLDSGPIALVWTSGTSGASRGVLLSAEAFRHHALATQSRLGLARTDRWHQSLAPSHVGGLALIARAALIGSELVVSGRFDLERLITLIVEGRVSHASLVPTMLHRVVGAWDSRPVPSSLRCLLVGGAAASPDLVDRALGVGFPVALTYGLTEATSQVATAHPELVRRKPGTVGPPLDGVDVRIGASGCVEVRGPTLAAGLIGTPDPLLGADGWLRTDDLGTIDDDGHLWITGRLSDRIITGGVNVDPLEVESVLTALDPIDDAVVLGLDDPEWGERLVALVVTRTGSELDATELDRYCRARLSVGKIPRAFAAVDRLARNPNGKVDRGAMRRVASHLLDPPLPSSASVRSAREPD